GGRHSVTSTTIPALSPATFSMSSTTARPSESSHRHRDMPRRPPNLTKIPYPARTQSMSDTVQGQGAATKELEELRQRVADLEAGKSRAPEAPAQRMVPLGAGWLDQFGRPVMVPARPESLGERLVRQDFAEVDRAEFEQNEAVQAIGREVVADTTLRSPI